MDKATQLEAQYCPPLDPALFYAIISDYDLGEQHGLQEAKALLDTLREDASLEETAEFDPSATSGDKQDTSLDSTEQDENHSLITDDTSLSNGLASLNLESSHGSIDLESYDEDTKVLLLAELFGDEISVETISSALKRCNGNWNTAMNELLTEVYFNDPEQEITAKTFKGIDGFAEDQVARKTRRRRNRRRASESAESSACESLTPAPSKWQTAKDDVDFIATRTSIPATSIRLLYNQQGASVSNTINAMLKEEMKNNSVDDQDTLRLSRELGDDFPTIAPAYLMSLIRITHPHSAYAHELAKALVARPRTSATDLVPQYNRVTNADIDGSTWQQSPKISLPRSSIGAENYAIARAQAFDKASAAHRKAKSDRLMGGAAAYYAQVGRDMSDAARSVTAANADALANSQSSASQVDLHGVDVLNAVRIAKQKTEQWWSGLGESRSNGRLGVSQRQDGFRIVVGLGRHSEGGKGKLGPAITKMLKTEGWRYENEGATILITGKQKT